MPIKKKLTCVLLMLIAFVMAGCEGSGVNLYYSAGENSIVYFLEIKLSDKIIERFNESAKNDGARQKDYLLGEDGASKPYTLTEYIQYACSTVHELTDSKNESKGGATYLSFRYEVSREDNNIFVQPSAEIEKNLFLYTIKAEAKNPFTSYYNEYVEAKSNGLCNTVMQVLANGKWDLRTIKSYETEKIETHLSQGWYETDIKDVYRLDLLPSLENAFPIAKNYSENQLETAFYFLTTYNLKTSGEKMVDDEGLYYYEFKSLFGSDEPIYYEYVRANSVGWNIVAILVGLAAVGFVYLFAKLKQKPKKQSITAQYKEKFPYDPFDESGGNGGSGGNPFEGY